MRHRRESVNFLGVSIRPHQTPKRSRSGVKLLITPSQGASKQIKGQRKGLLRTHVGSPTVALIHEMHPAIRGWSQSIRRGVPQEVCAAWDSFMDERAQRDMKRRHPRTSGGWRTQKYRGRTTGGRRDR
jgi:hypothetical protein